MLSIATGTTSRLTIYNHHLTMPLLKINWSSVPDSAFTLNNSTIAAQLGCSAENVRIERRRRGLPPARGRGKLPGDATGERRTVKPSTRLSRPALHHLRQLAAAAGVNTSAFILRLPLPENPPKK